MSEEKQELDIKPTANTDLLMLADSVLPDPAGDDQKAAPDPKPVTKATDSHPVDAGSPPEDLLDEPAKDDPPPKPDVEKDYPEPDGLSVNASKAFKSMRQKIAELSEAQDKAASDGASSEEVAKLKAQVEEYDSKIRRFDLMSSRRFVSEFVAPMRQTFDRLVEIGKEYEVPAETIRAMAAASGRARESELSRLGLSGASLARILPMFDRLAEQRAVYDNAVKNEKQTAEQLSRKEADELVKVQGEGLSVAAERLRNQNHFLLAESKKNPDWSKNIMAAARRIVAGQVSGEELAELALKAVVSDHYKNMYIRDVQEMRKAKSEASQIKDRIKDARPRMSGDTTSKPRGNEKTPASVEELAELL